MEFSLNKSLEILENTPQVISALLRNLSEDWINKNEGENTWTAKEVVAHLIVCEETDWMPRVKVILSSEGNKTFAPVDMKAHFEIADKLSLVNLLAQFKQLRAEGLAEINKLHLKEVDLKKSAIHPVLGEVTLQQLFSTWITHDLTHISQITRVIAEQNKELVGPFIKYLKILKYE